MLVLYFAFGLVVDALEHPLTWIVLLLHRIMDPISIGFELYGLYKLVKFGSQAFNWAEQHDKLSGLEYKFENLKHLRPAEIGHPEWAKADGTFDQRRRPFPAMRAAIAEAKEACARKDQGMLLSVMKKLAPGECAANDAMLEVQHSLQLIK